MGIPLIPNSWGAPLQEKWGPAAWKASAEARRKKAAGLTIHQRNSPVRVPALDTDLAITGQRTIQTPIGKIKAGVNPTPDIWRASNVSVAGSRASIIYGTRGSKQDVVSAFRHERGHITSQGEADRPAAQRLFGEKFGKRYASEVLAWRDAVKNAPFNRVHWAAVEDVLAGYLSTDSFHAKRVQKVHGASPHFETALNMAAVTTARRHVAALKRYARKLRRRDTTPAEAVA